MQLLDLVTCAVISTTCNSFASLPLPKPVKDGPGQEDDAKSSRSLIQARQMTDGLRQGLFNFGLSWRHVRNFSHVGRSDNPLHALEDNARGLADQLKAGVTNLNESRKKILLEMHSVADGLIVYMDGIIRRAEHPETANSPNVLRGIRLPPLLGNDILSTWEEQTYAVSSNTTALLAAISTQKRDQKRRASASLMQGITFVLLLLGAATVVVLPHLLVVPLLIKVFLGLLSLAYTPLCSVSMRSLLSWRTFRGRLQDIKEVERLLQSAVQEELLCMGQRMMQLCTSIQEIQQELLWVQARVQAESLRNVHVAELGAFSVGREQGQLRSCTEDSEFVDQVRQLYRSISVVEEALHSEMVAAECVAEKWERGDYASLLDAK